MKKVISLLLSIAMLFSITVGLDFSAYATTSGDFEYITLDDGTAKITKYTGSKTSVSIPSKLDGKTVTVLGYEAFYSCSVERVIIPNSVTNIDTRAFYYCESLENITIPNSVINIGNSAFDRCVSLENITIPNSVTNIGNWAFSDCESLTGITIPNSVISIGNRAFGSCANLSKVSIGSGLKTLGRAAFDFCYDLTEFAVSSSNKYFSAVKGVLYNKDKTAIIKYPSGITDSFFTIPNTVKTIEEGAFSQSYLQSISIPDCVTSIGDDAFYACRSLTNVTIPDSVITIGDGAFGTCTGLENIHFGSNLKSIGEMAFSVCYSLKRIDLPDSLTNIGDWAFRSCYELNEATISKNVSSIGYGIFEGIKNITEINVNPANKYFTVRDGVLYDKNMETLVLYPSGKTDEQFTVPDSVIAVGGGAFSRCPNLKELTLGENVRELGYEAVSRCLNLSKVTLGSQFRIIGSDAFMYDSALKEVYFKGNAPDNMKASGGRGYYFDDVEATVYYAEGDTTWTSDVLKSYGGTLTWETWDTPVVRSTDISSCNISLSNSTYTYDGNAKRPAVTVKDDSVTLRNGIDYTLAYTNNVNAGTATVAVKGIGNYKGIYQKNYTIYKAEQYVSASVSASKIKVGETAAIKAKAIGTLTYKSGNTNVATVSSSGVVTAKAAGTATITVTAAGNSNYKSAVNTITLTVIKSASKAVTLEDLTYSFSNSYESFGYSKNYRIPLERYKIFFNEQQAQSFYNRDGNWGGSCFGMATTAAMFNVPSSTVSVSDYNSSAKKVSGLKVSDKNTSVNLTVAQLIEAMQISQRSDTIVYAKSQNRNNLALLCENVKKVENGEPPVHISVSNSSSGHALLGYKLEKINNETSYLHVYDCNYPKTDRYIRLKTDSSGNYIGWYGYENYTSFSFTTYNEYQSVWAGRRTNLDRNINTMTINSDDFEIQSLDGDVVASMKDGNFISSSDDIIEGIFDDIDIENHIIYVPTDAYRVVNTETESTDDFEVGVVNVDQSIDVITVADSVDILVDDKQSASVATVNADYGEAYEITMSSGLDTSTDIEEVTYIGKCSENGATVGMSDGEMVADNYTNSTAVINSTTSGFGHEDSDIVLDKENTAITLDTSSFTYDGQRKEPKVKAVACDSQTLVEGVDYTVVYSNNINAGTAYATVYGINKYKGKSVKTFTIKPKQNSGCTAVLSSSNYTYNGSEKKPGVTVKDSAGKTISSKNYTVTYSNNKNVGTATAKITFKGNYSGTINKTFKINPKNTSISGVTAQYKGFTVKLNKYTTQTTGYQIQYSTSSKFTSAKTVSVGNTTTSKTVTGLAAKKKYYVRVRTYKTVGSTKYYSAWSGAKTVTTSSYPTTVMLSATSYTYDGKTKKPVVTVKNNGKKVSSKYYTVSYSSGRKNVGKYTVTIKFKSPYSGTVQKTFTVKPKSTTLSSVAAKSKGFTVKWKKQSTQVTGYEIQYATDSKFTKNKKMVNVSKNSITSKMISKLTASKKYYVRIRTYKTVKVNGKSEKIYSSWSKSKTVTTKK